MTSTPTLLNLPVPLLSAILGFLPSDEGTEDFSSALLASRALRKVGQLLLSELPLHLSSTKLQNAREAGDEAIMLAFVQQAAHVWRSAVVAVDNKQDLEVILQSLEPGHRAQMGMSLSELTVKFSRGMDSPPGIPQVLTNFTGLTALAIEQMHVHGDSQGQQRLPSGQLPRLSPLTALRSLKIDAAFSAFPAQALNRLQQLSRLELSQWDTSLDTVLLGAAHFGACTALRHLQLAGVVPTLSEQEARGSWQQLQYLSIEPASSCDNAGFWLALPSLKSLTSLGVTGFSRQLVDLISARLPACTTLEQLSLGGYSETAVPQLPTSLTGLAIANSPQLEFLPSSPALQSLELRDCISLAKIPTQASAMVQLKALRIVACEQQELSVQLAALPALEELALGGNPLSNLPQMAFLASLRRLDLLNCELHEVPEVLASGLASNLEYLNLAENEQLVVDNKGLATLSSLTALTYLGSWGISRVDLNGGVEALRSCLPNCDVIA